MMIPYNVSESKLAFPEYGRNIQRMVDHCLTIEDREERKRCACSIVEVMSTLFPTVVGEGGDRRKIWDHINIMSDFKLDIDFPVEVVTPEKLKIERSKIPYSESFVRYRNYGKSLQDMIKIVADMEASVEKDNMIFLLANQMKKVLLAVNPENSSDAKVFADIADISCGKIRIDASSYKLNSYIETETQNVKSKKKKNK